jgi:hypothetical protein
VELKYTKEIRKVLTDEMASPSEEFVKLFTSRVYTGRITPAVKQQFVELVKRSLHLFVSERLSDRLKTALAQESGEIAPPISVEIATSAGAASAEGTGDGIGRTDRIVTTAEELEAFYLVKGILRSSVDPSRIHYRDAISYFSILLDNNNRKTICRLYLNGSKKAIGFTNQERKEDKFPINSLDELYAHSERLQQAVTRLSQVKEESVEVLSE